MKKITYRKLDTGNYVGRCSKAYIFICKMPHGGYFAGCTIKFNKDYRLNFSEGHHGSSLTTISSAKKFIKEKLTYAFM